LPGSKAGWCTSEQRAATFCNALAVGSFAKQLGISLYADEAFELPWFELLTRCSKCAKLADQGSLRTVLRQVPVDH